MKTNIKIQVHALQPRWIADEKSNYRIYIDDDLITERTWIWDLDTVIEENIWVDVTEKISHTVWLETIKFNRGSMSQFGLRNLYLNGQQHPDHGDYRSELSFILE